VYYLAELLRPEWSEVELSDMGCQGDIYGDPEDKESGALEILQEAAETDAAKVSKESAEAEFWAARDSLTVPA